MAPKRKRTASVDRTSNAMQLKKRLQERIPRHSKPQQSTKRGFLDLPPELRNIIYELWTEDETIYIRPSGPDLFTSTHPAASLCRQARDELVNLVAQDSSFAALRIIAQVHDFNFYNVDQYMNLVEADERADLWDFTFDGGRELSVELTLTEAFCRDLPVGNLARWFRWMDSFELPPLIEYSFRHVAEPQKALEMFERFATGHGRSPYVRDVLGLFRSYVESRKKAPQVENREETEARKMVFLTGLMEEAGDLP